MTTNMKHLSPIEWRMLLNLFTCGPDEMRPPLEKPFGQSGYVCATDTHIVIQVDDRLIDGDFINNPKAPDVAKVIPKGKSTHFVSVGALRSVLASLDIDYNRFNEECPECDDDCEVEWDYTDKDGDKHHMYAECPCCHGSGNIPNGIRHIVEINNTLFSAHHILLIYRAMTMLGITETTILPGAMYRSWRFNLADGITVVVMPASKAGPNMRCANLNIKPLSEQSERSLQS